MGFRNIGIVNPSLSMMPGPLSEVLLARLLLCNDVTSGEEDGDGNSNVAPQLACICREARWQNHRDGALQATVAVQARRNVRIIPLRCNSQRPRVVLAVRTEPRFLWGSVRTPFRFGLQGKRRPWGSRRLGNDGEP